MYTIQVDEEIFGLLQKNAQAFVDTPNSALRRMLGLRVNGAAAKSVTALDDLAELIGKPMAGHRSKAPKANLKNLVAAGLLRNGERLYLVDYQGKKVPGYDAEIAGAYLEFKGQPYTMSHLARNLLKKVGFKSDSVRGPSHWVNSHNDTVTSLWQQCMDKKL